MEDIKEIIRSDKPHKNTPKLKLELACKIYVDNMFTHRTPHYNWQKAMKDAGYGPGYAKGHCHELWAKAEDQIDVLREKVEQRQKWDLDYIDQEYRDLIDVCKESKDRTNLKGTLDSMTRRKGGFLDKSLLGSNEEILNLTEEERNKYMMIAQAVARQMNIKLEKEG